MIWVQHLWVINYQHDKLCIFATTLRTSNMLPEILFTKLELIKGLDYLLRVFVLQKRPLEKTRCRCHSLMQEKPWKKIYIRNTHFLARDSNSLLQFTIFSFLEWSSLNTFTNENYELRIWQAWSLFKLFVENIWYMLHVMYISSWPILNFRAYRLQRTRLVILSCANSANFDGIIKKL